MGTGVIGAKVDELQSDADGREGTLLFAKMAKKASLGAQRCVFQSDGAHLGGGQVVAQSRLGPSV